jgi:transposase
VPDGEPPGRDRQDPRAVHRTDAHRGGLRAAHRADGGTDPTAGWLFVVDNLTTHCPETLVRWLAKLEGFEGNLGKKGSSGILENVETRRAFLVDASHRVRFLYTPKHCSWLNQIECWFSILVRRALRRGSCSSTETLAKRIREFIDYFNRLLAKPFRWTYSGRPLVV